MIARPDRLAPKRLIAQAAGIVAACLLIGVVFNLLSPRGIPYDCEKVPRPEKERPAAVAVGEVDETSLEAARAQVAADPALAEVFVIIEPGFVQDRIPLLNAFDLWSTDKAVFVDARTDNEYRKGHIEGALHFDVHHFDDEYPGPFADIPKTTPIIAYCAGTSCDLSMELAQRLAEEGYFLVGYVEDGWNVWVNNGFPAVTGPHPRAVVDSGDGAADAPASRGLAPLPATLLLVAGLGVLAVLIGLAGRHLTLPDSAHAALSVVCRLLLGALFITASYDKIGHAADFYWVVRDYHLLPCALGPLAAMVLPWIELVAGVLLILGLLTPGANAVVLGLTAVFTAGIISAIWRNLSMDCGCFDLFAIVEKIAGADTARRGWVRALSTVGWPTVIRDIVFMLPGIYLLLRPNRFLSLDALLEKTRPGGAKPFTG